MAITGVELLSDVPPLLELVQKLQAEIAALPQPPAPRHASDYSKIVVAVAPDLAALIDLIEGQAAS